MNPENHDIFIHVMIENGFDAGYAASALLDADPIPMAPHHLLTLLNAIRAEERARAAEVVRPLVGIAMLHIATGDIQSRAIKDGDFGPTITRAAAYLAYLADNQSKEG